MNPGSHRRACWTGSRTPTPHLSGWLLDRRLAHLDTLLNRRSVRRHGMPARYHGPCHRVPSRLHPNARKNVDQVFKQVGKDVAKHRVLVVSADHPGLTSTNKMLPDRSISEDKRIVHDQRGVNAGATKFLHPPAVQPAHVQVARRILWHKVRCPKIPVVMSKKDIAGAFRLLWVAPEDVELFGGDMEVLKGEEAVGEECCSAGVTVIYLVSSFGFSGSPGEWSMFGRVTEEYHRAHRPEQPRRDLRTGFDAKVLVDDCTLVEPYVGLRPWVSAEVFECGVRMMLGEAAINAEKDKIEGSFRTSQTVWGLVMDTVTEKVHLPERRIQKGAALLAEADFDYGASTLTLKQLQRFRGIMTGWTAVLRGLNNELKAADKFLQGNE